jgi:hypothetical protein
VTRNSRFSVHGREVRGARLDETISAHAIDFKRIPLLLREISIVYERAGQVFVVNLLAFGGLGVANVLPLQSQCSIGL